MFKKQTKVYRAGTVVNVSIISTSGRPVNHISNLTLPVGSVIDYGNTVNMTIDVERQVDGEHPGEKGAAHA